MAVITLNLDHLTLETLPTAVSQIEQGLAERLNIIRAFYGDVWGYNGTRLDFPALGNPNFAYQFRWMMTIIRRAAGYFVSLDPTRYIPDGGKDFPKRLIDTSESIPNSENGRTFPDPSDMEGDDWSLGAAVPGITSFGEWSMDEWADMLKSAANWLNLMTAVEIPSGYYRCYRSTGGQTLTVDDFSTPIPLNPPSEEGYASKCDFNLDYVTDTTHQGSDTYEYYTKRCRHIHNNLKVDNRTPYNAVCKMYLCLDTTKFVLSGGTWTPRRKSGTWYDYKKWPAVNFEMTLCSDVRTVPGQSNVVPTRVRTYNNNTSVLVNGQWRKHDEACVDTHYGNFINGNNTQSSKLTTTKSTNWSYDGTKSVILDETSESEGADSGSRHNSEPDNYLRFNWSSSGGTQFWDGLGMWQSWDVPLTENVPAHTIKLLDTLDFSVMPDVQNLDVWRGAVPDWTRGSYNWSETIMRTYRMRVEPIFDFTNSLTRYTIP